MIVYYNNRKYYGAEVEDRALVLTRPNGHKMAVPLLPNASVSFNEDSTSFTDMKMTDVAGKEKVLRIVTVDNDPDTLSFIATQKQLATDRGALTA